MAHDVAMRLRDQIPDIMRRWDARVRAEVPAAQWQQTSVLHDHLPEMLEIMVKILGDETDVATAAVDLGLRGTGIGRALVERVLAEAASYRVREVYLLTNTAERWFTRFGFRHVDRGDVPEPIRSTAEYRELCPASAAVMMREIERRREGR